MTDKDDILAAIEDLTDEQAQTLRGWLGALGQREKVEMSSSVGSLGDLLGVELVDREEGHARMKLEVDPAWHNPNGQLHGGVVYVMVDYSMGAAVQPFLPEGQFCATIECKISYLAGVRDGTLTVDTEVTKQGRSIAFTESKVADQDGKLVATATGSMFIIRP